MLTGQMSSHALHVVQAQISSTEMRSNTEFERHGQLVVLADDRRHRPAGCGGGHHVADLQHDLARVERLAGGVRRADARAAAAHRAGVGVEQLLPREVLDHVGAEGLERRLHQVGQRLHRPLGTIAVRQVHVHRRGEHVAQLRGRQDEQERDEGERVGDPERSGASPTCGCCSRTARTAGSRRPTTSRTSGRPIKRDAERLGEEAGDADDRERAEDHDVLGAALDADPVHLLDVAAEGRPADADRGTRRRPRRR